MLPMILTSGVAVSFLFSQPVWTAAPTWDEERQPRGRDAGEGHPRWGEGEPSEKSQGG